MDDRYPSLAEVQKLLRVDEETGNLYWKVNRKARIKAGDVAGHITKQGYIRVTVLSQRIFAHHIVWAIVNGRWAKDQIDHINGVKLDNRPCNLREATAADNSKNICISVRNTSGYKGVSWVPHLSKWKSELTVGGKRIYLGCHECKQRAAQVYEEAATKYFGEYKRGADG